MSGPVTQVLPGLGPFGREIGVIFADTVEIRTPAEAGLGVVRRLLDFLVRGTEELGRLGVEEGAVPALGLRVQSDSHQLLVLVGDQRLAEFYPLEDLPLGLQESVRDAGEEVRDKTQSLLDVGLDLGPAHRHCDLPWSGAARRLPGLWGVHSPRSWIGSTNTVRPGQHWPSPSQEHAK